MIELKGLSIAVSGYVFQLSSSAYRIRSLTAPFSWHRVYWSDDDKKWDCDCSYFVVQRAHCEHIFAAQYFGGLTLAYFKDDDTQPD